MGAKPVYQAMVSSDWSQCLSPSGPFDCISFSYPRLSDELNTVFKQYTGNRISLGEAADRIRKLLPAPLTADQMDAYLDEQFATYRGVPELIQWCLDNHILFMINTTAMVGYFQRVFARGLLPVIPVLSANPLIRFPRQREHCLPQILELREIQDKGKNTAAVARSREIAFERTILMGDSGGDGPHFEWGAQNGAFLIGSMAKPSLRAYCREKGIEIDLLFGISYRQGQERNPEKELAVDFMELVPVIERALSR